MGTRIGILIRHKERYDNDPEFKEKCLKHSKNWNERNKEKIRLKNKEWRQKLSEFKNNKCKECNKLLNYRTKGDYCLPHKKLGKHL